jgi:spermidine dehydrogenase
MIGSGAMLLAAGAPSFGTAAKAQTVDAPLTGLAEDWTGPGGIGDYAGKNGNTHKIVNAAHNDIRNGTLDKRFMTS